MTHEEITAAIMFRLIQQGTDPTEPVFAVSLRDVISAVVRRHGTASLNLGNDALLAACNEVAAACQHHDPARDLIAIGLDTWAITRTL